MALVSLHRMGLTNAEICRKFRRRFKRNIDRRTLQRTVARYKETRGVADRRRTGRPKKCPKGERQMLKRVALRNRWLSLPHLCEVVNQHVGEACHNLSTPTLWRELAALGIRRRVAARKPLINAAQRERRLQFAREHRHHQFWWRNVIFSDEKIFRGANNRRSLLVTRTKAERLHPACIHSAPKHCVQVHVWGPSAGLVLALSGA